MKMKILIEDYDRDVHGHYDDCDYVIEYEHSWEGCYRGSEALADQLAEMMGYETAGHRLVLTDLNTRLYLCHA